MPRVAVVEDDQPTSQLLKGWIEAAKPGLYVDQWFTTQSALEAVSRETYEVVVLDIELDGDRNAGFAILRAIHQKNSDTPVLVVSGMAATTYRGIMKALNAWDYLQKSTFDEVEFVDTFMHVLRSTQNRSLEKASENESPDDLVIDPYNALANTWKGQRLNIPQTALRFLRAIRAGNGEVVTYEMLFELVKTGKNKDNVRKHISNIREAMVDIDPGFDCIQTVPIAGFRWVSRGSSTAAKP